jgi:hypothetical protein
MSGWVFGAVWAFMPPLTNEAITKANPREIGSKKFNFAPAHCSLMLFPYRFANDRHRDYSIYCS